MLFLLEGFVFFEGDAFVEGLGAFVAFREEMETYTADVLLGAEGLGIIYLFTLNLQLHHAPFRKAYSVAFAQMTIDDFCDTHQYTLDGALAESSALGPFAAVSTIPATGPATAWGSVGSQAWRLFRTHFL